MLLIAFYSKRFHSRREPSSEQIHPAWRPAMAAPVSEAVTVKQSDASKRFSGLLARLIGPPPEGDFCRTFIPDQAAPPGSAAVESSDRHRAPSR